MSSLDRFITLIDQTEERVPAAQRRFSDEVLWFVLAVVEAVRLVRSAFLNGNVTATAIKKREGMAVRVKCWAIASRSGTTGRAWTSRELVHYCAEHHCRREKRA